MKKLKLKLCHCCTCNVKCLNNYQVVFKDFGVRRMCIESDLRDSYLHRSLII